VVNQEKLLTHETALPRVNSSRASAVLYCDWLLYSQSLFLILTESQYRTVFSSDPELTNRSKSKAKKKGGISCRQFMSCSSSAHEAVKGLAAAPSPNVPQRTFPRPFAETKMPRRRRFGRIVGRAGSAPTGSPPGHHQLLRRAEFSVRCVPVPFLAETEKKTRPRASEGWGRPAERARLRPTLLQPASSKCARDFLSDTRTHRHSISPPAARIIARSLASLCSPAFRCPRTH
jgi:hypothetical protein